jgi:DNA processing protein
MSNELLYQLALTQVPHIGHVHARVLVEKMGSAEAIFKARAALLEKIEGIGTVRARAIHSFRDFRTAEKEIAFIEKFRITPLFLTDQQYPQRLLHCYDPPTLLFYRGSADLNASKVVAVIGTRSNTAYGKEITEKLVSDLAYLQVLVVSGLAFGIDAIAHRSAIRHSLPTVGVLAHGLDAMYPQEHAGLARDMVNHQGGLLTEFTSGTKPDKHHFPTRNRIVAGMCDAVVVVETGAKGGSIITAGLANGYNRDVFAFPGRATDARSAGCHYLIKSNKAVLITEAVDIIESMGWERPPVVQTGQQRAIFAELTPAEQAIVQLLQENQPLHIDELHIRSGLSTSAVATAILNLELQNVVRCLPGKLYQLL